MLGDDIYHLIQRSDNEGDLLRVLDVGFPVDQRDGTGWTALHHAAHMGRRDCLATLLEYGADVNARTTREGQTALFLASRGGHLPCLQILHSYHKWALDEMASGAAGSSVMAIAPLLNVADDDSLCEGCQVRRKAWTRVARTSKSTGCGHLSTSQSIGAPLRLLRGCGLGPLTTTFPQYRGGVRALPRTLRLGRHQCTVRLLGSGRDECDGP